MLSVSTQADSFLEVVHAEQMVFPLPIEHAQLNHALVISHRFGANQLLFGFVALFQFFENPIAQFGTIQFVGIEPLCREIHTKAREDLLL